MAKPIFVGITGGIGTGKSTVCKILDTLGIPVYNADERTKKLMHENVAIIENIKKEFGEEAYKNSVLDRKYLGQLVFSNTEKLKKLNAIVHPFSISDADAWAATQTTHYVIKEAALLFETEAFHHVDIVIGVTAPKHIRIQRVMQRDSVTKEEVERRINNQIPDTIKMKLCNYVITNDNQQMLIPQVYKIHKEILQLK